VFIFISKENPKMTHESVLNKKFKWIFFYGGLG